MMFGRNLYLLFAGVHEPNNVEQISFHHSTVV